jgi:hypothetical protein
MNSVPPNPKARPPCPVRSHPNVSVRRAPQLSQRQVRPVPVPPRRVAPSHQPANRDQPWLIPALTIGAALIFMLPGLLLTLLFVYFEWGNVIYPGVTVDNVQVGWLTPEKAADKLDAAWKNDHILQVSDNVSTWTAKPEDFGLLLDTSATIDQAFSIGRGQGWGAELIQIVTQLQSPVAPIIAFNPETAREVLQTAAPVIGTPPREAHLSYIGGHWQGTSGEAGNVLDIEATVRGIAVDPDLVMNSGYLQLIMTPVQPEIADTTLVVDYLNQTYPAPPRFEVYDPIEDTSSDLPVPLEVLASWIKTEGGSGHALFLEQQAIIQYLQGWEDEHLESSLTLDTTFKTEDILQAWQKDVPFPLFVKHNPFEYTVQPGERLVAIGERFGIPYWKILEANPGISPNYVTAGQVLLIPSPNELLPLPIVRNKRILISLSEQRMRSYEDGNLLNEYIVSTGIEDSPTHPGIFQVQTHEINAYASVWDLYMPHFLGIYEGWPGFMNGIHGLPTLSSGRLMWAGALGGPASYGCIVIGLKEAESLYDWAESGVIVEITR